MKSMEIIDEMQASLTKLRGSLRPTGTAGECICIFPTLNNPDCPVHGWVAIFKGQKAAYDRLHNPPDLPLHVRVAKALGKDVNHYDGKWRMMIPHVDAWWRCPAIPDYSNDLVAAMGALEEYGQGFDVWIYRYAIGTQWRVNLGNGLVVIDNDSLPQAICEAIVAHAEGK